MKVVGAGFGRTGTLSLKVALEQLGVGAAFHLMDLPLHPPTLSRWQEAADGKDVDWVEILNGWEATVDWPGAAFWRQIWESFPDSKVLLSVREPTAWYRSCVDTIFATASAVARGDLLASAFNLMPEVVRFNRQLVWEGTFGGRFENESHALEVFTRHNREVQEIVPAEKLLVYEVDEGWEPLCRFLEIPVPPIPTPHLNDRTSFRSLAGLPPLAP
jgi:hypothetical protein